MRRVLTGIAVATVLTDLGFAQTTLTETHKIKPSDDDSYTYFGHAVAISGEWAAFGAAGTDRLYMFRDTGHRYVEEQVFEWEQGFGQAVAIDGHRMVAGEPGGPRGIPRIHIYEYDGDRWDRTAFFASEKNSLFGQSVAIDGSTIVIGAPSHGETGVAVVFEQDGTDWFEAAVLTASDSESGDLFGTDVAIDGNTIVVGAPNGRNTRGLAHVFQKGNQGWEEVQVLQSPRDQVIGYFGHRVDVEASWVLVSAPGEDPIGRAYLFDEQDGWDSIFTFKPKGDYNAFGASAVLDGDQVLLGDDNLGTVVIYRGAADSWEHERTLKPGEDEMTFGFSCDIDDGEIVVGAHHAKGKDGAPQHGRVYVYREISLRAEESTLYEGDDLNVHVYGGEPNTCMMVKVKDEAAPNGWRRLAIDRFDANGEWQGSYTVPPGLEGLDIVLMGCGWAIGSGLRVSNKKKISFR